MPTVMLRYNDSGGLDFYVPKKDLEESIVSMEFNTDEKWGGEVELGDGSKYYLEPAPKPNLPQTMRAKRL
ncbi:putative nitrogen fixation protein NifT [Candidatus Albibeggiatoa sp. nov. BB20]|uniref:putative nitrogen fixation protein NifT n=1 Tax=Candidatus Albibeggiatoa sp. nov. BB20 TaxID=3162723 RepID=UPI0033656268